MKNDEVKAGMGRAMMSEMMQNMMKVMGSNIPEICMKMMEHMKEFGMPTSYVSPEMRGLFEESMQKLEEEVIAFVRDKGKATPSDIAKKLKISEESALFLVWKLARTGRLVIDEISIPEKSNSRA